MRIVARNQTSTPVTIDRKGHQLGAGETDVVDTDDRVTDGELAAGNLAEIDRPAAAAGVDVDEGVAAAFAKLDALEAGHGEPDADADLENAAAAHAAAGSAPAPKKTTAARKATT